MDVIGGLERCQLLLIAIGVALLGYVVSVLRSPLAKLPGPWYTKWTDVVLRYKMITGTQPLYVHALHQKYGPVVRIRPGEASVLDTAAAQQIFNVKTEFRKARWYKDFIPRDPPNIVSSIDVNYHRRQRRLLAAEMSETGLTIHKPVVESKIRLAIERMAEEMEERGATDVYRWFLYLTTDVIGELSFGSSFRMLENKEENQYVRDLKLIGFASALRSIIPFLTRISAFVKLPVVSAGKRSQERIQLYATQSLGRHYKLVEEQGRNTKPTLLSKVYRASENDVDTLSFEELRETAMSYIIAGSDTTTNTLTYLVWAVCKRPDIKAKLLAELETLPADFSDQHLKELPYLNQIIQETLRLYSAVPTALPREVPPEGATMAGHFIPGGYTVSVQAYSMHRIADAFPDPLRFDPSRWENPTQEMKNAFMPWGGGSRICLGLHLAKTELRLTTAHFFKRFPKAQVSLLDGFTDDDMEPVLYFLMSPRSQRCLIDAR